MKPLAFILLFISLSLAYAKTSPEDLSQLFHMANRHYEQGQYDLAIQNYQELANGNLASGEIFYNLGNSLFRNGELGKAIFNYRMAQRLLPRDPDVKFNLDYARQKTVDQIERKTSFVSKAFSFLPSLNPKETYYFLLISSVLFWGLCIFHLLKRTEVGRWARLASFILFVIAILMVGRQSLHRKVIGAVVTKESKIYSAIGRDNVVLFTLHEGAEFEVTRSLDGKWLQIILSDGKKGWIASEDTVFES